MLLWPKWLGLSFGILVVLQTIINKFPEELVNAWCEVFFLPLVQRLTSDPSSQCREAVGACLRALMLRAAPEPLDKLVQYCLIWLGGGDARLARTAAQVRAPASPHTLHNSHARLISSLRHPGFY